MVSQTIHQRLLGLGGDYSKLKEKDQNLLLSSPDDMREILRREDPEFADFERRKGKEAADAVFEDMLKSESPLTAFPKSVGQGGAQILSAPGGLMSILEENLGTGTDYGKTAFDFWNEAGQDLAPDTIPGTWSDIGNKAVSNITANAPAAAATMALTPVIGPAPAANVGLGLMGLMATGNKYPELRKRQQAGELQGGPGLAALGAGLSGGVESLTEKIGFDELMGGRYGMAILGDILGEETANVGNELVERYVMGKPEEKHVPLFEAATDPETAWVSLFSQGGQAGIHSAIQKVLAPAPQQSRKSEILMGISDMLGSGASNEEIDQRISEIVNDPALPKEERAAIKQAAIRIRKEMFDLDQKRQVESANTPGLPEDEVSFLNQTMESLGIPNPKELISKVLGRPVDDLANLTPLESQGISDFLSNPDNLTQFSEEEQLAKMQQEEDARKAQDDQEFQRLLQEEQAQNEEAQLQQMAAEEEKSKQEYEQEFKSLLQEEEQAKLQNDRARLDVVQNRLLAIGEKLNQQIAQEETQQTAKVEDQKQTMVSQAASILSFIRSAPTGTELEQQAKREAKEKFQEFPLTIKRAALEQLREEEAKPAQEAPQVQTTEQPPVAAPQVPPSAPLVPPSPVVQMPIPGNVQQASEALGQSNDQMPWDFEEKPSEAPAPQKKQKKQKRLISHSQAIEDNPVLKFISEMGGILSKKRAKTSGGEYDDMPAPSFLGGFNRVVMGGNKIKADQMATMLFAEGHIKDDKPSTMWAAIRSAIEGVRNVQKGQKSVAAQDEHLTNWYESGSEVVPAEALRVGQEFSVQGEKFKVIEEGDSAVKLKDGAEVWIPFESGSDQAEIRIDKGSMTNSGFESDVEKLRNGTLPTQTILKIGLPGEVLTNAGFPNAEIELTQSVVREKMEKHPEITWDLITQIPGAIKAPIMVFPSRNNPGSKTILTELRAENGSNVVVAVDIGIARNKSVVNDIRTIFGRSQNEINDWFEMIDNGKIKPDFINSEKQKTWKESYQGSSTGEPGNLSTSSNLNMHPSSPEVKAPVNPRGGNALIPIEIPIALAQAGLTKAVEFSRSIYRAGMEYIDFGKQLIKEFGRGIAKHVKAIWDHTLRSFAMKRGGTDLFSSSEMSSEEAQVMNLAADDSFDVDKADAETKAMFQRVAQKQAADVEEKYAYALKEHDENGKPLPGPNGKPSKLTRGQWVQVRTPLFKQWFGDWESVATKETLQTQTGVIVDPGELAGLSGITLREKAKIAFGKIRMVEGRPRTVLTRDGREVFFGMRGFKETARHSADARVLQVIPQLPEIIKDAVPLWDEAPDSQESPQIKRWRYYGAKAVFEGSPAYVKILLREATDGTMYYDNDATSAEIMEGSETASHPSPSRGMDYPNPLLNKLYRWWHSVNPDSVSKVVDENGEPLVVYHGTKSVPFSKFDLKKTSEVGFHFGTIGQANQFTIQNWGRESIAPRVYPVFLAIKSPYSIGDVFSPVPNRAARHLQEDGMITMKDRETVASLESYGWDFLKEILLKRGYDGFTYVNEQETVNAAPDGKSLSPAERVRENTAWVIFRPNQIKSSIGNTGTFSKSPVILYSAEYLMAKYTAKGLKAAWVYSVELAKTAKTYLEFGKAMIQKFGRKIANSLKEMWEDAKRHHAMNRRRGSVPVVPKENGKLLLDRSAPEPSGLGPTGPASAETPSASEGSTQGNVSRRSGVKSSSDSNLTPPTPKVKSTKAQLDVARKAEKTALKLVVKTVEDGAKSAEKKRGSAEYRKRITALWDRIKAKRFEKRGIQKAAVDLAYQVLSPAERGKLVRAILAADTPARFESVFRQIEKAIASVEHKEALTRFRKTVSRSSQWLKKMLPEFREIARDMIERFSDFTPGKLFNAFKTYFESGSSDTTWPSDLLLKIKGIDKTNIRDVSTEDLNAASEVIQRAVHLNKIKDKLIGSVKKTDATLAANRIAKHVEENNSLLEKETRSGAVQTARKGAVDTYLENHLDVEGFVEKMGDSGVQEIYDPIREGRRKSLEIEFQGKDALEKAFNEAKLKTEEDREKWLSEKVTISTDGGQKELSRNQKLELIAHLTDADTRQEILNGGLKIKSDKTDFQAVLSNENIEEILKTASPQEMAVVKAMKEFLNKPLKKMVNEQTLILEGREVAFKEDYFPRSRDRDAFDFDVETGFQTEKYLENQGMLKERVANKMPVLIGAATETFKRHVSKTSAFIGLAVPIRNVRTILQAKVGGRSTPLSQVITARLGKQYADQIGKLLKALAENAQAPESEKWPWINKLLRNISVGHLGLRPQSAFKQASGIPLMFAEVSPATMLKAIGGMADMKRIKDLMNKYSPFLRSRYENSALSLVQPEFGPKESTREKYLWLLKQGDMAVSAVAWRAAELEMEKKWPDLEGDALYQNVARRAEEIVSRTQNATDLIDMSMTAIESRGDTLGAMTMMFTSPANRLLNVIARQYRRYSSGKISGAVFVGTTGTAVVGSALIEQTVNELVRAIMRGDDPKEEESRIARMTKNSVMNLGESFYYMDKVIPAFVRAFNAASGKNTKGAFEFDKGPLVSDMENAMRGIIQGAKAMREGYSADLNKNGESKAVKTFLVGSMKTIKGLLPMAGIPSFPFEVIGKASEKVNAATVDDGEAAYQAIREKAKAFEDDRKDPMEDFRETARLKWKKARRENDQAGARSAYEEFLKAGGRPVDFRKFIRNQGPLSVLEKRSRSDFLKSLSEEDKETLRKAQEWSDRAK